MSRPWNALSAALLAAALGAMALPARAQQADPAGKPATVRPADLLTPEEREAYREKQQAAKTPEERQKLRDEQRALVEQRAKEKGITLPPPRQARGGPIGPGPGPRGERSEQSLLTPQERTQMQERMQAAKTPEERQKLRDEYRSLAETRAKERGVTMRPPRDPAQGRGGRMPMAGQDLFTQEERIAQHAKIKAAATPEEQQKLRDEFRAEAQARAASRAGNTPAQQPPAAQPTPQPSPQPK